MAKTGTADAGLFVPFAFPSEGSARLALNPRGTRLAISWEGADSVRVIDSRTGREVASRTGFPRVIGIEFLSASVLLVRTDGGCFRCDLGRGGHRVRLSEARAGGAAVSPNGRVVALGVDRGLVFHDARTGRVLRSVKTDLGFVGNDCPTMARRIAFSPGGRYVAAALSEAYYHSYLVVVWEVRTGRRQRVFDTLAHALAFRDDTLKLWLADDWGHVNIYEPDQGEEPAVQFKIENSGRAIRFEEGGRVLAVLLNPGSVARFAAETGRALRRTKSPARDGLDCAVTSADWSAFTAATQDGVAVWPGDNAEPRAAPDPTLKAGPGR